MRTHVSKMFVGPGIVAGDPAEGEVAVAPWGDIQAFLTDATTLPAAALSDEFGFLQIKDGQPLVSGPFKSATATMDSNAYKAEVPQEGTLTIDVTNLEAGTPYQFKIVYHDNISIVPNLIKSTKVSVVFEAGDTATAYAAKVAAAFNAQDYKFVDASSAAGVVTFTAIIMSTLSKYNRIDRPESVVFEIAAGNINYDNETPVGAFAVVDQSVEPVLGQGDAARVAWLEDQHQGRRGYSDRRMWNNPYKFVPSAVAGTTYSIINVLDNKSVEGDMQNIRHNPIGSIVGIVSAGAAAFITAMETITGGSVVAIP